jgi:hypothetical protein
LSRHPTNRERWSVANWIPATSAGMTTVAERLMRLTTLGAMFGVQVFRWTKPAADEQGRTPKGSFFRTNSS